MALNRQNQQNIQDTATYVEDTLRSVAANIGEALKSAVDNAFTSADASLLTTVSKDFVRNMNAAARDSEQLVKNAVGLREGLTTSADLAKQVQGIELKRLALTRQFEYLKSLATDQDTQQLALMKAHHDAALAALDVQEASIAADEILAKDIEKRIGLTGKLAASVAKIPGLGKFVDAKNIEQELRKAAAAGKNSFQIMGKAAGMVGKQLLTGLLDPLAFVTLIYTNFLKVDKAATDFTRITGQNTSAISSMNSSLATTVDILQVATDLSKEIGISGANFITPKQLAAVAEAKNLYGLSAEQATNLAIQSKLSGQGAEGYNKSIMNGVKQSNALNSSGVEFGLVQKDVLSASQDITLSLGNSGTKLGAAATAARRFGLSLKQVDDIASGLLNFEDSISNELEAQLLTGKNINLSKARELALNNDLEGVANELAKNGATAAEFGKMNRIQQEGLAKALGMSREQLAKSIIANQANSDLTAKQKADIMGMKEEDYQRLEVQDKITKSLEKLAQAFAPILEDFVLPIVEGLSKLLTLPLAPYLLGGAVLVRSMGGGILKMVTGMGGFAKSILGAIKNFDILNIKQALFGKMFKGGQFLPGGGRAAAGGQRVGGLFNRSTSAASTAATGGKAGGGLMESFSKVNTTSLIKGAAAMAIASIGIFIFAKAIQELEKVEDWSKVAIGLGLFTVSLAAFAAIAYFASGAMYVAAPALLAFGASIFLFGAGIGLAAAGMSMFVDSISKLTMDSVMPMLLLGPALFGIAAGLGAVALAGLTAIPAIGGLVLLSKAAPGLVSLGMGGGEKSVGESKSKSDEGTLAAVEAKLAELIAVVKTGGNVYLDSNKVGRAGALATSNTE